MFPRTLRRLAVLGAVLTTSLGLAAPSPVAAREVTPDHARYWTPFQLVSAAHTLGWYPVKHRFEWEGTKEVGPWKRVGAGGQYVHAGMLGLMAKAGAKGGVSTTWQTKGYDRGRWEVRLRTDRESTGAADYAVRVELVPSAPKQQHCGAQDIAILDFHPSRMSTANFYARTLPDTEFRTSRTLSRPVGSDEWHVYGVEVTPKHIRWFVDAKLVAEEKRPAAFSGVPLTMRVAMEPEKEGQVMNKTRVNLDWARYWTLDKKGKHPGTAGGTDQGTYRAAC